MSIVDPIGPTVKRFRHTTLERCPDRAAGAPAQGGVAGRWQRAVAAILDSHTGFLLTGGRCPPRYCVMDLAEKDLATALERERFADNDRDRNKDWYAVMSTQ